VRAARGDGRTRLRVGLIFGAFETAMPIIGLLLGHGLAGALGRAAHWIGAGLLIATGLYALVQASRDTDANQGGPADQDTGRLLVTGLALSTDNLAVGFALGAYRVNFTAAAVVIGAVSVALSLLGWRSGRGSVPGPGPGARSSAAWCSSAWASPSPRA